MIDSKTVQEVQKELIAAVQRGQEQVRKGQERVRKGQEQVRKSREAVVGEGEAILTMSAEPGIATLVDDNRFYSVRVPRTTLRENVADFDARSVDHRSLPCTVDHSLACLQTTDRHTFWSRCCRHKSRRTY